MFRNVEHRVESMRAQGQSSSGDKGIVETHLRPIAYPYLNAMPAIEPPGNVTLDAPTVSTVQHVLVELTSLYNKMDFDQLTAHDAAFEVLRIELPVLFDKARRYSDLLHSPLEQRPRTMKNLDSEKINKLLERYVSEIYSSVLAFRKLIGPELKLDVRVEKKKEALSVLSKTVASISQLNLEAATAFSPGSDYLFKTSSLTNQVKPQLKVLVHMRCSRVDGAWENMDRFWVDPRHLILGDFPKPRPRIVSKLDLQRLIDRWSGNKAEQMKLSPRQYGILKQGNQLEDVMAEFRPYPKNLKNNSMDEYRSRRFEFCLLARMLLSTQDAELRVSFPCVKFRCLAEIENPDNPGFVLVYLAKGSAAWVKRSRNLMRAGRHLHRKESSS